MRRQRNWTKLLKLGWVPLCLIFAACHLEMYNQPKAKTYSASTFFKDGASARPIQPGTVARGQLRDNEALYTGQQNGQLVTEIPIQVDLKRGEDRFNIFCTPCHGQFGAGNGAVAALLNPRPASLYIQRLRDAPVGHFYQVITHGVVRVDNQIITDGSSQTGNQTMYSYAARIRPEDRWAIVAYIRDLQANKRPQVTDDQFRGVTPTPAAAPGQTTAAPAQATAAPAQGTAVPAQPTATP